MNQLNQDLLNIWTRQLATHIQYHKIIKKKNQTQSYHHPNNYHQIALKNQSSPLLKTTGKVLEFIGDDETPDYLKQSDDNYWDDDVDAGKTYQNGLDGAQRVSGKTFYR